MKYLICFMLGLWLGGMVGVTAMCLFVAGRDSDEKEADADAFRPEAQEPGD